MTSLSVSCTGWLERVGALLCKVLETVGQHRDSGCGGRRLRGWTGGLGVGDLTTFQQDVNDHAPECEPPFQELTVYAHLGPSLEVTTVSCRVAQEPQRLAFSYRIVGGEGHGSHGGRGGPPGCWGGAGQGQPWSPSSPTLFFRE